MTYVNYVWGKYRSWSPAEIYTPSTLEELREIIVRAKAKNAKIRTAGSFHSLNDLCATNSIQIHTENLNRVLNIDKIRPSIKVQGGIKIKNLLQILAGSGLTLPNQGYIVEQSIAGAIATATHGSGNTGTLSSFVEEIELLDAYGTLRTLSPTSNEHLFSAAVVGLGCLGIVYSVTLRCIRLPRLHLSRSKSIVSETLKQLPDHLHRNDYFQFAIDPYSDELITWGYQKTIEGYSHQWLYKLKWLLIKGLAVWSFDIFPTPNWLMPFTLKIWLAVAPLKSCIDDSYKLLSPDDEGHYTEEEIAVPIEHLEKALETTRSIIDRWSSNKKRMVAVILVRFAKPDAFGYLSPALGRQTAYISLITIKKKEHLELFKEFESAMYQYEGRPHWGKVHFLNKDRIAQLYGSNFVKFLEARKELDPEGLFSNDYVDSFLN